MAKRPSLKEGRTMRTNTLQLSSDFTHALWCIWTHSDTNRHMYELKSNLSRMWEGKSCIQDLCALKSKFLSQVFSDFWCLWASQKIKLGALEVPQRLSTCCSCRRPRFVSQHAHGQHNYSYSYRRLGQPLLAFINTRHTHGAHTGKSLNHRKLMFFF